MKRLLKLIASLALLSFLALLAYGGKGWWDARSDAPDLRKRVMALTAQGLNAETLGAEKRSILIRVEDPSFDNNNGTDFSTPGAGQTTITQSVSKRVAFTEFKPGLRKIRQTAYAIGLSQSLDKEEVLTLFLNETSFRGSDGQWVKGFDAASRRFFNTPLSELDRDHFVQLLAAGIAPKEFAPDKPDAKLNERIARIERLLARKCKPSSHDDVQLVGCA